MFFHFTFYVLHKIYEIVYVHKEKEEDEKKRQIYCNFHAFVRFLMLLPLHFKWKDA